MVTILQLFHLAQHESRVWPHCVSVFCPLWPSLIQSCPLHCCYILLFSSSLFACSSASPSAHRDPSGVVPSLSSPCDHALLPGNCIVGICLYPTPPCATRGVGRAACVVRPDFWLFQQKLPPAVSGELGRGSDMSGCGGSRVGHHLLRWYLPTPQSTHNFVRPLGPCKLLLRPLQFLVEAERGHMEREHLAQLSCT